MRISESNFIRTSPNARAFLYRYCSNESQYRGKYCYYYFNTHHCKKAALIVPALSSQTKRFQWIKSGKWKRKFSVHVVILYFGPFEFLPQKSVISRSPLSYSEMYFPKGFLKIFSKRPKSFYVIPVKFSWKFDID